MSWKATFEKGVACFKCGDLQEALNHMNQAAELQSDNFTIYDSRAAVYEKLGNHKAALRDSKRVIDLAPDRWQGYARSARLFNSIQKHDSAVKMADHALTRLRPNEVQRRTQLTELRDQAVIAQAAADKQRSQTSYLLGKLPVETLVEIFSVLITEDHTWAIKLSHVCGHWRRILLNTPSAWHTLVLSGRHPLRKAKLWMERARSRIMKLSFSVPPVDQDVVLNGLKGIAWNDVSSLRISAPAFRLLYQVLSRISLTHPFSNLQELSLDNLTYEEQLACFLTGPDWNLQSLQLEGVVPMDDQWGQHINQLRELRLRGHVQPLSLQTLRANPSLESLTIDGSIPRIIPLEDTTPIIMDNLRHIEFSHVRRPFDVLSSIVAPSITNLSLHGAPFNVDETLRHLAPRHTLVELRVSACNIDPCTLPSVLSETPGLETLQINSVEHVVNGVLEFLTPKNIPLPCPSLKHVDLSRCSDLTTSNIYAFVKSRLQHGSGPDNPAGTCALIDSLTVDGCPKIEPDMLPWFRSKISRFNCVYMTKKDLKRR